MVKKSKTTENILLFDGFNVSLHDKTIE